MVIIMLEWWRRFSLKKKGGFLRDKVCLKVTDLEQKWPVMVNFYLST